MDIAYLRKKIGQIDMKLSISLGFSRTLIKLGKHNWLLLDRELEVQNDTTEHCGYHLS